MSPDLYTAAPGAVDLAAHVSKTSTGEAVQFWILGIVAVAGALGTVLMKKAVHSALMLAATMLCLAVFYLAQGAVFLGIVQIVVYTGAIMMLFLFVLMLVGVSSADSLKETLRGQRWAAAAAGLGFGILLIAGIANAGIKNFAGIDPAPVPTPPATTDPATLAAHRQGNVQEIAHLLFTKYVWAFEVTSALLITAALGAMVLAHRERITPRKSQRELAEERVRDNRQVAPLPTPGVYARHNAVDIPALLPDGSISELSVNQTLRARGQVRDVSKEPVHRVAELEESTDAWMEHRAELPPARHQDEPDEAEGDDPDGGPPRPAGGASAPQVSDEGPVGPDTSVAAGSREGSA